MKKISGIYILDTTDYKILETISELNQRDYYPLPEGVYKILIGSEDEDMREFNEISTYKTLVSYSSKKVSRLIIMLLRYNFLEKIYDQKTDKLYLKLSIKGELDLAKYQKIHKYKFTQKKVNKSPCIVKIK